MSKTHGYQCQNDETHHVVLYYCQNSFDADSMTVLSIGENDGKTLSNSFDLIAMGWRGILLEPSVEAFSLLQQLHADNEKVVCYNFGIAEQTGMMEFFESGSYKRQNQDLSLFSTLIPTEKERWKDEVDFTTEKAMFYSFADFCQHHIEKHPFLGIPGETIKFDYLTIDAEGYDYKILQQINLAVHGCSCVCIEHNGNHQLLSLYESYFKSYGLSLIYTSAENVVYAKI